MDKNKKHPQQYTLSEVLGFLLITIIIFISVLFLVEIFSSYVVKCLLYVCSIIFECIATIYITNKKFINQNKEGGGVKEEDISLPAIVMQNVALLKKNIKSLIISKSRLKFRAWLFSTITLGVVAGHFDCSERFIAAVIGFAHPEEVKSIVSEIKSEDDDSLNLNETEMEWFQSQDADLVETVEKLQISQNELNRERELNNITKAEVFFFDGTYAIDNWDSETEILNKVRCLIYDKVSMQKKNIFDLSESEGGAIPEYKGEIARISEEEPFVVDFEERREMMQIRQDIFAIYPKSSLANLISNDEHLLALTLYYYKGNENSIVYYYSKSIEYRFDRIEFAEISKDHLKNELEWISARYADIAYTCKGSEYAAYAEKLQNAFKQLAAEY